MAPLCSCQGSVRRAPVSGHAAARWEGFEPSSPGLEPGILACWTTTAHGCASAAPPRTDYQKSRVDFWISRCGRIRYAHVNVDSCSLPSSCFLTLRITGDGEAESRSGQQLFCRRCSNRLVDAQLETVAHLLQRRNVIDAEIAAIINRPMTSGHLGE